MGQLDKYWLEYMYEEEDKKKNNIDTSDDYSSSVPASKSFRQTILDNINSLTVSGITSRDDIVNPEKWLSQYYSTVPTSVDGIANYNEYLQLLRNIQAQQQASYDEWYNSPDQQNLRDREAGLNTDLLGLSGSSTSSPDVGSGTPTQGLPTSDELALQEQSLKIQKFTNIVSSLSTVASLASAFSTLPLNIQQAKNLKKVGEQLSLQNEQLSLQNESSFGAMLASDIADLYGTAKQVHLNSGSTEAFDTAAWFAQDDNFAPLAAVYGHNPRYEAQLNKQRNAVLEHLRTAALKQKEYVANDYGVSDIISSPFYTSDQKLTMLQLRPFKVACQKADQAEVVLRETLANIRGQYANGLNIKTAVDVANNQNKYTSDYYSELNGKLVAAYEQFLREVSMPGLSLEKSINEGYKQLFESDPSGESGWKAAYLYGSNGGSSWHEAYMIRNDEKFRTIIDSEVAQAQATGDFSRLQSLSSALHNLSISYDSYNGNMNFVSRYLEYYKKVEKLLNLAGYDVDIVE